MNIEMKGDALMPEKEKATGHRQQVSDSSKITRCMCLALQNKIYVAHNLSHSSMP